MNLRIFIDGASRGNPGPAAVGVVINDETGKKVKHIHNTLGVATNNVAEYEALNCALEHAKILKGKRLKIFSDSQLLVNQLAKSFKVKNPNIKPLYYKALQLIENFEKVEIEHIERAQNKEADSLANLALDQASKEPQKQTAKAFFEKKEDFPQDLF